jgi:hypothetical protein
MCNGTVKNNAFNKAKIVPQNQLTQIHYIIGKYRMKTGKLRWQHGNYKGRSCTDHTTRVALIHIPPSATPSATPVQPLELFVYYCLALDMLLQY